MATDTLPAAENPPTDKSLPARDRQFDECYGRFNFNDEHLSFDPNLKAHTATRLIRLADGVYNVAELLRAMLDQLPNSTDSDLPRAMLAWMNHRMGLAPLPVGP